MKQAYLGCVRIYFVLSKKLNSYLSCNLLDARPIGMHISAIRKFIADHSQVKTEHLTTSQCNRTIVKSESAGTGKPYIGKYEGLKDSDGRPFVATATVFVSHAWQYAFYDVVVDVMEQHAKEHPEAYFWFDLFTNDQNEMTSKDFNWFCTTFRDGVRNIGNVLLALSPWNDPIPVKRAWCLFEISNAIDDPEVTFEIGLPSTQTKDLRSAVVGDSECLIQALSDIQAQKAQAKMESDRDMIFDVIKKSEGGFPHVDEQVKNGLRSWYIEQLLGLVENATADSQLLLTVAKILQRFGQYQKALKCAERCFQFTDPGDEYLIDLYNTLATTYHKTNESDRALEYHNKSIALKLESLGDKQPDVAISFIYHNTANVHVEKGDLAKAFDYYEKSLAIRLTELGENHPYVADAYNSLASYYSKKGDQDKALKYYRKALSIRLNTVGENHPAVASSYYNIASQLKDKGEFDTAIDLYNKSLAVRLKTVGENHPDVATTYNNMGDLHRNKREFDKALDCHKKALALRLKSPEDNDSEVAGSYNNIANVYNERDDFGNALEYYHKSLTITVGKYGENRLDVADTYENMAVAYLSMNVLDMALEYENKTLFIRHSILGPKHEKVGKAVYVINLIQQTQAEALQDLHL